MKLGGSMPLCSLMWPDAPHSCCPDSPLWWVCPRRVNRDRLSLLSQAFVGVIPHQPQPQHYSEVIWKCRLWRFHFCFLLTIFFSYRLPALGNQHKGGHFKMKLLSAEPCTSRGSVILTICSSLFLVSLAFPIEDGSVWLTLLNTSKDCTKNRMVLPLVGFFLISNMQFIDSEI